MQAYTGEYSFDERTIGNWEAGGRVIGVYYCWTINAFGGKACVYVGRAVSDGGIRGRLLQHLGEDKWRDVTHFGYTVCSTANEAIQHEANEIYRMQPKYNKVGK